MAAAAAPRFFTYKPGAAPAGAGANAVKLKAGQQLAFQPGKGYYAKTAAAPNPYAPPTRPAPAPPVNPMAPQTPDQINTAADAQAQGVLTPQQDEIRRQQALAAANATADESKITGLQTASAELLKGLAPQEQAAYQQAANTEGSLGQGLATGVQQDVASRVAADKSFMESQGQQGGSGPDATALHDTVYDLNGRIPGDTFAEQGAAAAALGLAQAPIALSAGREELAARMAQARTDNDGYAQQLIQIAAQFPAEKAKALQQLNQYELDKANYRVSAAHTAKSDALAARSEHAQEVAAGITATINKGKLAVAKGALAYKWASLNFQSQKEAAKAQAAVRKGKTIDVSASKLLGHIVYKDGSQDAGIKVKQSNGATTPGGITAAAKVKARMTANTTAYKTATTLLGKPVAAPKGSKGAYVAKPGSKPSATFPPAYPNGPVTTNNPKYANHAGAASGWQDAFTKTWAAVDGDTLVASYGYTKEQVTAWVTAALRRAGWKRK